MLYNILDYLGANELAKRLHISKSFLQWFAAINPDIVYSLLGSSALVRFVYDLTNVINIPLALHFMDDWPSVLYRNGLLASVVRKRLITELNTLVSKATLTMAISDQMSIEFEGRYQRHFSTFHNALDLNLWRSHARTSWDLSNPIEVLYTGRIGIANQYSLIDVAYAISSLNQDGLNIRFTIVTQNINHPAVDILRKILCVSIIPPIPHEMIPSRLAAADILVLPLDFGGAEEIYAKYSMPTKSVEYMASGVPIVIYAPSDHAVSNYANSEGWAIVVGEKSPRSLKDAFLNLANNLDLRSKLAHRAILISRKNHNISLISEIFRENLATASIQRQPTSFPS
jgi:glycosyltransferase involved in cell wall biosynthesis